MTRLYDSYGRPVTPEARPDGRTLAVASLRDRYSGYPSKGLTPGTLGSIFREADAGGVYRQMELFEEMEEKDTHLFGILQKRKLAVTGLDYEVRPFSEDKKDREIADFVEEVLYGLPDLEDNLFDVLDAVGKSYSALELHWDVKAGKNVVRGMEWVHPKKFTWWNSITPKLLTDESPSLGIDLPAFKFLFHIHKAKSGYPTRQGILRVCAWMYLFKNYDIKDWVAFAEVYGMPLRLGKYDPSATKEDKDALIQAVRSLGSDAAGIISKSTEIEFVEAVKTSSQSVYETLAAFCNAEMSKAVLGHSAGADSTPGKLGNETGASEVRDDIRKADCEAVAKAIRRDLIRPLVGFNYGWDAPLPWFKFLYEAPEDLDTEATRYKTLIEAGMEIGEEHMQEKFGIPKPKQGEKTVGMRGIGGRMTAAERGVHPEDGSASPACPACLVNKSSVGQASRLSDTGEAIRDTVDHATERLMDEADISPLLEPVKKLLDKATHLEELRDMLLDVYKDMNPADLGNLMQRAFMAAELAGRFEGTVPDLRTERSGVVESGLSPKSERESGDK